MSSSAAADDALVFADLEPGRVFRPATFHITPEMVKEFAEITGDDNPIYVDEGLGELQAHPAFAACFLRLAYLTEKPGPAGTVLAKQEIDFLRPLKPGDTLTSHAKVIDRYEKRGRKYVTFSVETQKADGEPAARGKITVIWPR